MTALSAWFPEIQPHVPAAPEPLLEQALRFAGDEFCTRSGIVQQFLQADSAAGVSTVTFTPPVNTEVRRFIKVWHLDQEIFSAGPTLVDRPDAYGTPPSGTPARYLDQQGNVVRVYPAPDATTANAFSAVAVLAPAAAATELPDVLYREWRQAIAAGARAYIKAIPGQPFTGDGSGDAAFFSRRLNEAIWIATTGNVRGEVRMEAPVRFGHFANERQAWSR